jgi:hypothetical protein
MNAKTLCRYTTMSFCGLWLLYWVSTTTFR